MSSSLSKRQSSCWMPGNEGSPKPDIKVLNGPIYHVPRRSGFSLSFWTDSIAFIILPPCSLTSDLRQFNNLLLLVFPIKFQEDRQPDERTR